MIRRLLIPLLAVLFVAGCATDIYSVIGEATRAYDEYRASKPKPPKTEVTGLDYGVGWGMVNHWMRDPVAMADAAAEHGIGVVHIAYFGWGATDSYAHPERLEEPYRLLRRATERNGQILFAEIANDNKGQGKYGDDKKGLDEYVDEIRRAADFIALVGADWLQPVGETRTKAGKDFEAYCAARFDKKQLVYNGGSRPDKPASWASMFAWHPASVDANPPRGAIAVSDHSGILSQLYGSGWQGDARGDPDAIRAWAARMRERGHVTILYAFGQSTIDRKSLEALAAMSKSGIPDTSPTPPAGEDRLMAAFNWTYGGFDGSRAQLDAPRIADARFGADRIDFRWETGLGSWGLGHSDAGALFCLFLRNSDGEWVGGKLDWVSTSRAWRGFNNIFKTPYKGWTVAGIPNPCEAAIVVVSEDGRKRSNILTGEWRR